MDISRYRDKQLEGTTKPAGKSGLRSWEKEKYSFQEELKDQGTLAGVKQSDAGAWAQQKMGEKYQLVLQYYQAHDKGQNPSDEEKIAYSQYEVFYNNYDKEIQEALAQPRRYITTDKMYVTYSGQVSEAYWDGNLSTSYYSLLPEKESPKWYREKSGSSSMEDYIASENTTSSEDSDGGHPPHVSHYQKS